MHKFACPSCGQRTIGIAEKFNATSFDPFRCPQCRAEVYPSGKQTALWRSAQAMIVTLIVVRALIDFSWILVAVALVIILVMEALRLFLVPIVKLRRIGQ